MLLALATWGAAVRGTFQYDDFENVLREPSTLDLLRATGLRPLLRASYLVDHALWGWNAHGFLVTNVLLHAASVLGARSLAAALSRTGAGPGALAPLVAAALFAVQPAHAETIAYVSGRSTGLMSALLLWGLALHARGRAKSGLALLVLASLAKEVALIFPALLWLVERDVRKLAAPSLAAAAVAAGLACVPRYRELALWSLAARDPLESVLVDLRALPELASLWLRPWALSVEHAFDPAPDLAGSLAGGLGIAATLALAYVLRRRAPLVGFALGWALIALAPTHSLLARADPIGERALYLAWFGPAVLLGDAIARLASRAPARALSAAALLVALGAGFAAARVRVWSDERLLWADAVAKAPASARAWNNLGMAYFVHDEYELAREALGRALAIDPQHPRAAENLRQLELACGRRCQRE